VILTPVSTVNRPGLSALAYRVGTFSAFYETMLSRLSSAQLPALAAFAARSPDDPGVALLDAWAAVLDVLSFYQERIANEGYLRTAVERDSIVHLARMTGYALNPGVASSVFLAYTLDKNQSVTIAAGSRAQSMAAQGALPQSFETSDDLYASDTYNNLGIRATQPSMLQAGTNVIYVDGVANNLRANDLLLLIANGTKTARRIATIELQPKQMQTKVQLQPAIAPVTPAPVTPTPAPAAAAVPAASSGAGTGTDSGTSPAAGASPPPSPPSAGKGSVTFERLMALLDPMLKQPAGHPQNPQEMTSDPAASFAPTSDNTVAMLKALNPGIEPQLDAAFRNTPITPAPATQVYVMRVKAGPFGSNARPRFIAPSVQTGGPGQDVEWTLQRTVEGGAEAFALDTQLVGSGGPGLPSARIIALTVTLGQKSIMRNNTDVVQGHPVTIDFPDANESILISVLPAAGGPGTPAATVERTPGVTVGIAFKQRGASITLTAPQLAIAVSGIIVTSAIPTQDPHGPRYTVYGNIPSLGTTQPTETPDLLSLDASYDQIQPNTWVVLDGAKSLIAQATSVAVVSRADYGLVGRVTQLTLNQPWIDPEKDSFSAIRNTTVYAQAEALTLREETITDTVSGQRLELDDLYTGLQAGRWLIVQGERVDLPGVTSAELVMLASVDQDVRQQADGTPIPGEQVHSFLNLTDALAYEYTRSTVTISGNVAHATQGESRPEVLGGGDASLALQTFTLHQQPLTYVSSGTATGSQSTLQIRVNGVLWDEAPNLLAMGPTDRKYLTATDDSGTTSVIFGDGVHGLRPPTGTENIKANYRSGMGTSGNVAGGAISMLATRPKGTRSVVNPLPASGGADPESGDSARRNAPVGLSSLNRLISVEDYQDFSRSFAGVAKASAALLHAVTPLVFVTVAGADGLPLDPNSDLIANLTSALLNLGDPNFPVQVASCTLLLIFINANVSVLPDYQWETVEPDIRAALLEEFAFANRDLGQDILASEVIAAIQSVEGIEYVDVQALATITQQFTSADLARLSLAATVPDRIRVNGSRRDRKGQLIAAAVAFLSPDISDLVILNRISQ